MLLNEEADAAGRWLSETRARTEALLATRMERLRGSVPDALHEAMAYSLLGGGKRLRPLLCLSFAAAVQAGAERTATVEDAACALEFVHTYSLVHDDLPAMDDDDLRRGRPTNHRVFGEAMAILAGDALLTQAFSLLAGPGPDAGRLALVAELALASGPAGMVGGQVLDIAEARPREEGYLNRLHRMKTGALIRAACRMGVLAAGGTGAQLEAAGRYGERIGLAFQIADDVLDVVGSASELGKPTGADEAAGRFTYVSLMGVGDARKLADRLVAEALEAVQPLEPGSGPLAALARLSVERRS